MASICHVCTGIGTPVLLAEYICISQALSLYDCIVTIISLYYHRFKWVEICLSRIAILLVWDSLMVTNNLSWLYRQSNGKDIYKIQLSKRVRRPLPSLSLDQSLAILCQQLIVCVEAVIWRRVGWQIVGPWFSKGLLKFYPPLNTRRSRIVITFTLWISFCQTCFGINSKVVRYYTSSARLLILISFFGITLKITQYWVATQSIRGGLCLPSKDWCR